MSSVLYPWLRLDVGFFLGCWFGVLVGCGLTILLAGRRFRQLQTANVVLRLKLRIQEKTLPRRSGPVVIVPAARGPVGAPLVRVADRR
jgi:hypothetical protein